MHYSTGVKVNQAVVDKTSGHGNTQNILSATESACRDNEICDMPLIKSIMFILLARINGELFPESNQPLAHVTSKDVNQALLDCLRDWSSRATVRQKGVERFYSTLGGVGVALAKAGIYLENLPMFQMLECNKSKKYSRVNTEIGRIVDRLLAERKAAKAA